MKKELVSLKKVGKTYLNGGVEGSLFVDLSLSVKRSEFIAVFGPNGCGKTTLLNLIAGIDKEHTGLCVRNPHLKVSFVFQNYREALFPWLTVRENISFPLTLNGVSPEMRNKAVLVLCEKLSVSLNLDAYPYTLSGGQQQMVSILRALITKPDLLLMDEPFSALDYETTLFLLDKTQEIWKKTGVAIIFVSHEIDESVLLAERVIVLGRSPTRIVSEIIGNLPYPRGSDVIGSNDFHKTKNRVLSAFLGGCRK